MLPDDVLLEIFYFYLDDEDEDEDDGTKNRVDMWHTLVHVCRKWRNVVFGSPRRLNLRLRSTESTPVRAALDIWPPFPIVLEVYICGFFDLLVESEWDTWDTDNIIAALEHNDRICEIEFDEFPRSQSGKVLPAMHQPFPALTRLNLDFVGLIPVQPQADSFLGGSAPCLRYLRFYWIPFPGLPKLLLSATHLVHLELLQIPDDGYIPSEAMATCLSVLTSLEILIIQFESPQSHPIRRLPPKTHTLLPVLTKLTFGGDDGYLEDLVAGIDAPLLDNLNITFFYQHIFDTPRLMRFINRIPKFKGHSKANIDITDSNVSVTLLDGGFHLKIECDDPDLQLSSLEQVCSLLFRQALNHAVEHLYITSHLSLFNWLQGIVESRQWLDLLHLFSAVKCLYISCEFALRIAPALEDLDGDSAKEVLPALQTIFLEENALSGTVWEAIGQFVAARLLVGHPISVSGWERTILNN
jgi:hypothetical protein